MINNDSFSDQASNTIDLRRYFFQIWHWLWLIVVVALIVGGVIYYLYRRITPVYQATTQLLVSDPPRSAGAPDTVVTGYYAANTYAEMLTDSPVLDQVARELNIDVSTRDLKKAISARVIPNTQVLSVTVEDTRPQRAANIANKLGSVFTERIREIQGERYSITKANLQAQIKDTETQIELRTAELNKASEPLDKDAKLGQYLNTRTNLLDSYEQVRLAEAQNQTTVVQVEPAAVPLVPVGPHPLRSGLLGALVGAILAVSIVVLLDALDNTLKDPVDLSRRTKLPIIGLIPYTETEKKGSVTRLDPRSPVSEAYRALRTNIQFANAAHKLSRIVVTSPTPQDGKTTVSSNLAIIVAQGGQTVTLIDADMRRPRIHSVFGVPNNQGLSGLFLKQVNLDAATCGVGVENLGIITSGALPPNPAELLASKRMEELLAEVQTKNDMIVIDTPPVLSVTDSSVLIPYIDGIVLVVQVGQTHVPAILQAVNNLRQVGANIVGLVVNGIKFNGSNSGYYSNYYHYTDEYGQDGKKKKSGKKSKKEQSSQELSQ